MNTMALGILIIGVATFLTVAGALACRKIAVNAEFEEYQGMADPMLNVVATLFSILLGFLVAGAMDDFSSTRDVVEQEANRLADIYALSRGLPDANQKELQEACRQYCDIMIKEEWPAMEQRHTSEKIWDSSRRIWDAALTFSPSDERETDIHESLIAAVQELGADRRSRIVAMREGYSPALWIVVFGGSIILIGCTYMFFIKNTRLQAYMVAMVALSLYLNISLLWIYSHPFVGDLKIKSSAFELDQKIFSKPLPKLTLPPSDSKDDDDDKSSADDKKSGDGSDSKKSGNNSQTSADDKKSAGSNKASAGDKKNGDSKISKTSDKKNTTSKPSADGDN